MPFSFADKNDINSVFVAGVLNLTDDSFYGKSRCLGPDEALARAERMVEEGADLLDVGAESSRPGSLPISEEEELDRLMPAIPTLCKRLKVPVSVDTYKPGVAERVLAAGAGWINDIAGLQGDPAMAGTVARHHAGVIMMHMRGTPRTMQDNPRYRDLFGEIIQYLKKSVAIAEDAGIAPGKMIVDPGIGFGKTSEHNLELLRHFERFREIGKPVLLGASRKSFIGNVLGLPVEERLEGSLAVAAIGVLKGARVLRVHDVKETVRAVKMARAIMGPNEERK